MLNYIRKQKHKVVGVLVASLLATTMVAFGVTTYRGRRLPQGQHDFAAKVDDEEISFDEFNRRVRDMTEQLRSQYRQNFEQIRQFINFDQQAIDALIAERLINRLVQGLRLTASSQSIEERLLALPFFGGNYNEQSFKMLLQSRGLSAAGLEEQIREELARTQLRGAVTDLSIISQTEARDIFRAKNSMYKFSYGEVPSTRFLSQTKVDDEVKLEAFYNERQEDYRKPAGVRYQFVKFDPKDAEKKVDVTNDDLLDAYNSRKSSFTEPKKIHLREIFFKRVDKGEALAKALGMPAPPEAGATEADANAAKKKQAEQILERLKNGESFDALARSTTESETGKQNGGDLGWQSIQDLPAGVRSSVESMVPGEFSKVLESPDGFRIVFLDEIQEPRQKEFEEVKDKLESEQRIADAPMYAYAEAEEFLNRFESKEGKQSFADFAKSEQRSALGSGGFLDDTVDPQQGMPGLSAKALSIIEGQAQVVQIESVPFVVFTEEKRESQIPPLADVRSEVEENYKQALSVDLAKAFAQNLLKVARENGANLADAAAKENIELKQTEEFSPQTVKDPLFSSLEVKEAAFGLSPENPLPAEPAQRENSFYVFKLEKLTPPDNAGFEKERKDITTSEMYSGGTRAYQALIGALKARAEITINPAIFDKRR